MNGTSSPQALDREQKQAIKQDGYVILPRAVSGALVDRALRAINASLGSEGMAPAKLATFRARTYTPELVASDAIRGLLLDSGLNELVESAIGVGKVKPPSEGQIALRFPTTGAGGAAVPHVDGVSGPGNGVPPGTLYHFTALAGVFLSDVPTPDRGNLTVWPGSHHALAAFLRTNGVAGLVNGYPPLPLGAPRPIVAQAGDAILAHYLLAHGVAPNLSPHVRYAAFFRLFHIDHAGFGVRALHDPFLEWEGMRDV